jgi:hypothetical protein
MEELQPTRITIDSVISGDNKEFNPICSKVPVGEKRLNA